MKSIEIDYLKYYKNLRLKTIEEHTYVFDPIRKKYIRLLPEELVRQLCLEYLFEEKHYTKSLICVERTIKYAQFSRRYDILVFTKDAKPLLLIECKAPNIKLNQKVLDQIAHYNLKLKVPYLFITNGKFNYCFSLNDQKDAYNVIKEIPNSKTNVLKK